MCSKLVDRFREVGFVYLSHRPRRQHRTEDVEKLWEHIVATVEAGRRLSDHVENIARLLKKIANSARLSCQEEKVAQFIVDFTLFHHDAGKGDINYQLYAHRVVKKILMPHNFASIAFLNKSNIYTEFLEELEDLSVDVGLADRLFSVCLTAILVHHEYYDYKDLSSLNIIATSTILKSKKLEEAKAVFHSDSFYAELQRAAEKVGFYVIPNRLREIMVIDAVEACSDIVVQHYMFGAEKLLSSWKRYISVDRYEALTASLSSALTWLITLADNIASRRRGGEAGRYAELISKYYAWGGSR